MAKKEDIQDALSKMDAKDDDSWTEQGLPKVDVVEAMIGEKVSRQEITDADPKFNREAASEDSGEGGAPSSEDSGEASPEDSGSGDDMLRAFVDREEPMDQGEFAKFMRQMPKENLRELEELLTGQQQDAEEHKARAADLSARIRGNLSLLRSEIKMRLPQQSNQDAIREYINSQSKIREERHRRREAILDRIDPEDLDPRAPIDRAMARRTGRGGKRPARI